MLYQLELLACTNRVDVTGWSFSAACITHCHLSTINLFGFLVGSMCFAERTELFQFQLMRNSPFIFSCRIVALLTFLAGKGDDISHFGDPKYMNCSRAFCPAAVVEFLLLPLPTDAAGRFTR